MEISLTKREFWQLIRDARSGEFSSGEREYTLEFNEFLNPKEVDNLAFFKDYFLFDSKQRVFQLSLDNLANKYPNLLKIVNNINAYEVTLRRINSITVKKSCPSCSSNSLAFTLPRRIVLLQRQPVITIDLNCPTCLHSNEPYCECEYCHKNRKQTNKEAIELLTSHFMFLSEYFLKFSQTENDPISTGFKAWEEILKKNTKNLAPISDTLFTCFQNHLFLLKKFQIVDLYKIFFENYNIDKQGLSFIKSSIEKLGPHYIPELFLSHTVFNEAIIVDSYKKLIEPEQKLDIRKYSDDAFIEFAVKVARIHEIDISKMPVLTQEKILELTSILSEEEAFYAIKSNINEAIKHFNSQRLTKLNLKKIILSYLNTAKERIESSLQPNGVISQEELRDTWHIRQKIIPSYHSFAMSNFKDHNDLMKTLNRCFDRQPLIHERFV